MIPDLAARNVAAQEGVAGSVLETYRRLLALRRASPALSVGSFRRLESGHPAVLAWLREAPGGRNLVAINFGLGPARVRLPGGDWHWRFDTHDPAPSRPVADDLPLKGLEAVILGDGSA